MSIDKHDFHQLTELEQRLRGGAVSTPSVADLFRMLNHMSEGVNSNFEQMASDLMRLTVSLQAIHKVLVDKGLYTEAEFSESFKAIATNIQKNMEEQAKKESEAEPRIIL